MYATTAEGDAVNREMTLPEAALTLGLSWHRAYRLVLSRKLESRRVAGRYLVTRESVERLRGAASKKSIRRLYGAD